MLREIHMSEKVEKGKLIRNPLKFIFKLNGFYTFMMAVSEFLALLAFRLPLLKPSKSPS